MTPGRITFVVLLAAVACLVARAGFRRDRFLGWLLVVACLLYVTAGVVFAEYLQTVRHRSYFAPDEVAYVAEGRAIVSAFSGGAPYKPAMVGGYPRWNAVAVAMWGPSLAPMRAANAIVGMTAVLAGYLLALSLSGGKASARVAAVLLTFSPTLVLWSAVNLKERALGLGALLTMVAALRLIERWSWPRLALFALVLYFLVDLRYFYGAILAWLTIPLYGALVHTSLQKRLAFSTAVLLVTGIVLQIGTGSFLATGVTSETFVRYVPIEGSDEDELLYGGTAGQGEQVGRPMPLHFVSNVAFVLLGRFEPRGRIGVTFSRVLFVDWLLMLLALPLAVYGSILTIWRRQPAVILPLGFIGGLVVLFALIDGDPWTTLRFRVVYWPTLLVLAAVGLQYAFPRRFRPRPADAALVRRFVAS